MSVECGERDYRYDECSKISYCVSEEDILYDDLFFASRELRELRLRGFERINMPRRHLWNSIYLKI